MGTTDLNIKGYNYSVETALINQCYDSRYIIHDIALIKTDRDLIPINTDPNNVNTICLPEKDSKPTDRQLFTAGWGVYQKYSKKVSETLQLIKSTLYSEK